MSREDSGSSTLSMLYVSRKIKTVASHFTKESAGVTEVDASLLRIRRRVDFPAGNPDPLSEVH